jgi:adenylate cyclase
MRPGTRRRLRLLLRVVIAGAVVGGVYGTLASFASRGMAFHGALVGVFNGALLSAVIGAVETFGHRTPLGRRLEEAPFLLSVGLKGAFYGALIALVVAGDVGVRLFDLHAASAPLQNPLAPLSLVFSFAVTFLFIFVLEMGRLVGGQALRDVVLGRYHRPRVEERFFLFVDVVGSTTLAERLGPTGAHQFLRRVFGLAADPIDDHEGEVHQYVGDEVVVTWPLDRGRRGGNALACFFAIARELERAAPAFEREFGGVPRIRGALHAGEVISGEVGESRRALVFHGDVMNTAARIEQLTRELGRRYLVSGDALDRLSPGADFALDDVGLQRIRGRESPVPIFAVEVKPR